MKTQWEVMEEWLESKPPIIRELFVKYPPNGHFTLEGERVWVMGYSEDGGLGISPVNPFINYEAAIAAKRELCPCCVDKLILKQ